MTVLLCEHSKHYKLRIKQVHSRLRWQQWKLESAIMKRILTESVYWIGSLHNRNWMNPLLKVANFEDSDIFNGE